MMNECSPPELYKRRWFDAAKRMDPNTLVVDRDGVFPEFAALYPNPTPCVGESVCARGIVCGMCEQFSWGQVTW